MERLEQYCWTREHFKVEWFSGTGPGGQNRNKVQACCRVTHLPTGMKVTGQSHRSRAANFREAFQRLGRMLESWIMQDIRENNPQRKPSKETIRTYHLADNRVLDHASRFSMAATALDKRFGDMILARREAICKQIMAEE